MLCHDIDLGALISVCSGGPQLGPRKLTSTPKSTEEVYVYDIASVQYLR